MQKLLLLVFCYTGPGVVAQPVFHILSADTNFYCWVGTPEQIACSKGHWGVDCTPARWERRPDAPDGLYYIYYPYEKFMHSVYPEKQSDTVCYEVVNYINGKREGKSIAWYFKANQVLAEELYANGILKNQVIYNRYAHTTPYSHRDPLLKGKWPLTGHYDDPLTIIYHNTFDSLARNIYSRASILRDMDTCIFYEEWESYGDSTIRVLHYNSYIPGSPPTDEVVMNNTRLTFKRWCADGELYYHREEKIYRYYDGSRDVIEEHVILNLLHPYDQEKDRWWDYCNSR
jgi:hypothetical protein